MDRAMPGSVDEISTLLDTMWDLNASGVVIAIRDNASGPSLVERELLSLFNTLYYLALVPVATVGNLLTLVVVYYVVRHKRGRRCIPDLCLGVLAAVDLLSVFLVHSVSLGALSRGRWTYPPWTCTYQAFAASVYMKTEFLVQVLITLDRHFAVVRPLRYHAFSSVFTLKLVVLGVVVSAFGTTVLAFVLGSRPSTLFLPSWKFCVASSSLASSLDIAISATTGLVFVCGIAVFIVCNVTLIVILRRYHARRANDLLHQISEAVKARERDIFGQQQRSMCQNNKSDSAIKKRHTADKCQRNCRGDGGGEGVTCIDDCLMKHNRAINEGTYIHTSGRELKTNKHKSAVGNSWDSHVPALYDDGRDNGSMQSISDQVAETGTRQVPKTGVTADLTTGGTPLPRDSERSIDGRAINKLQLENISRHATEIVPSDVNHGDDNEVGSIEGGLIPIEVKTNGAEPSARLISCSSERGGLDAPTSEASELCPPAFTPIHNPVKHDFPTKETRQSNGKARPAYLPRSLPRQGTQDTSTTYLDTHDDPEAVGDSRDDAYHLLHAGAPYQAFHLETDDNADDDVFQEPEGQHSRDYVSIPDETGRPDATASTTRRQPSSSSCHCSRLHSPPPLSPGAAPSGGGAGARGLLGLERTAYVQLQMQKFLKKMQRKAKKQKSDLVLARLVLLSATVFVLTWLPYALVTLLSYCRVDVGAVITEVSLKLVFLNAFLNPMFYGLCRKTYRGGYSYLLQFASHYLCCGIVKKPGENKVFFESRKKRVAQHLGAVAAGWPDDKDLQAQSPPPAPAPATRCHHQALETSARAFALLSNTLAAHHEDPGAAAALGASAGAFLPSKQLRDLFERCLLLDNDSDDSDSASSSSTIDYEALALDECDFYETLRQVWGRGPPVTSRAGGQTSALFPGVGHRSPQRGEGDQQDGDSDIVLDVDYDALLMQDFQLPL